MASDKVVGPGEKDGDVSPMLVQLSDDVVAAVGLGKGDSKGRRVRVATVEMEYATPQDLVEVGIPGPACESPAGRTLKVNKSFPSRN